MVAGVGFVKGIALHPCAFGPADRRCRSVYRSRFALPHEPVSSFTYPTYH